LKACENQQILIKNKISNKQKSIKDINTKIFEMNQEMVNIRKNLKPQLESENIFCRKHTERIAKLSPA
jgi:molecular chaperone GrpE (heat shock protein)